MPRRLAGLGGLLFLVLTFATLALAPTPPEPDAAPAEFVLWLTEHDTGIAWSGVLYAVAFVALIGWFAGMTDLVGRGDEGRGLAAAAAVGLAVATVGWALSGAVGSAAALAVDDLDESTVVLAMVVYGAVAAIGATGFAVLVGGLSVLGLRSGTVPRWMAVLGGVTAVVEVASLVTLTTRSSAVFSIVFVGFALLVVWLTATSVVLLRPAPVTTT